MASMERVLVQNPYPTQDVDEEKTCVTQVRSKWEFAAQGDNQISFPAGVIIEVTGQAPVASGWWHGEYDGHAGLFPINYTEVFEVEKLVYKKLKIRTASVSNRIRDLQAQIGHLHQSSEPTLVENALLSKNNLPMPVPASEPVLPVAVVENAPVAEPAGEESEESEESESSVSSESSESSSEDSSLEVSVVSEEEEEEGEEEAPVAEGKLVEETEETQLDLPADEPVPVEDESTPVVLQIEEEEPVKQAQELMGVVVEEPEETPLVVLEDPTPDHEDNQYTAAVGTISQDDGKDEPADEPDDLPQFLEEQASSPLSERASSDFGSEVLANASEVSLVDTVREQAPHSVDVPVPVAVSWQDACAEGSLEAVQRMVNEGVDINQQDAQGRTGLHLAMQNSRVEVVLYLLQQKAVVGILDNEKHLPHTQAGCSTNMRRVLISNLTEEPQWVPDETSPTCLICNAQFTFFFRRHHCRCCGVLACGNCTRFRASAPKIYKNNSAQRVCSYCHPVLTATTR